MSQRRNIIKFDIMRNSIKTLVLSFVLVLAAIPAFAQKQINITTRKDKVSDFKSKTTKVVLSGNSMSDEFLKEAMSSVWRISPYEFCTKEEYESLKTSDSYYYLMSIAGQSKKETEPGITFLTLLKGGKEAEGGLDEMIEVVTMPYCSAKFPSGREITYLPAILETMQDFTQKLLNSELKGATNPSFYNDLSKCKYKDIYFSQDDLSPEVTDEAIEKTFKKGMIVVDEDVADEKFSDSEDETVVSYIVCPTDAEIGSYCYKMLFDCNTHELYYFRKHKITAKAGAGFLLEDIKKIAGSKPGK